MNDSDLLMFLFGIAIGFISLLTLTFRLGYKVKSDEDNEEKLSNKMTGTKDESWRQS
jgi:hypothetical protein